MAASGGICAPVAARHLLAARDLEKLRGALTLVWRRDNDVSSSIVADVKMKYQWGQ